MADNGLAGFGENGAATGQNGSLTFSPEESAAATAATQNLIERFEEPTSKDALNAQIRAAAQWARDRIDPWYKRPSTWTWIVGGGLLLGGGYWFYRRMQRIRRA